MESFLSARRSAWCGVLGLVLVLGTAGQARSQELPEGKGKDVVEERCTVCHGTSNFTESRYSKQDWEYVVNDMIDRGALITDEESEIIVDYLTEHFGPEEKPKGASQGEAGEEKKAKEANP